jgi:hypothetical protein
MMDQPVVDKYHPKVLGWKEVSPNDWEDLEGVIHRFHSNCVPVVLVMRPFNMWKDPISDT